MNYFSNFAEFAYDCHQRSTFAGWWSTSISPDVIPKKIALIHSEISEAWEGFVSGNRDEHLPERSNFVVELADTLIRIGDLAEYMKISKAIHFHLLNHEHSWPDLDKILKNGPAYILNELHRYTSAALEGVRKGRKNNVELNFARVIYLINEMDNRYCGKIINTVTLEKREYNAVRADHKMEARNGIEGKKF